MMARLFPAGLGGPSPAVPGAGAASSPSPRAAAAPFQPAPRLAERSTADGKSPGALRMSQGASLADGRPVPQHQKFSACFVAATGLTTDGDLQVAI